jgi:hypothetical protein
MNNLFKGILQQFERNKKYRVILFRYLLYSVGLIDSLLLPKLFEAKIYAEYEYFKNGVFLFPNVMLGAYSGYMYVRYSKGYDLHKYLFKIGSWISFVFGVIFCIYLNNLFLLIPFLAMNFFIITEQKLKVNKEYILAFTFKPLLSTIVLIVGLVYYYYPSSTYHGFNASKLVLIVFSISIVVWIILVRDFISSNINFFTFRRIEFLKYWYLVRKIFTGTLASLLFGLLLFFERFMVKNYYPEYLAEYSMSFNISQIIVVILSIFSYISSVELGENHLGLNKEALKSEIITNFFKFCIFLLCFIMAIFAISTFYAEFENLLWMSSILTFSKGIFFFIGIYSPIAVYRDFNTLMLRYIIVIFIFDMLISFLMVQFNIEIKYLLVFNSFLIIAYTSLILNILLRRVEYKTSHQ